MTKSIQTTPPRQTYSQSVIDGEVREIRGGNDGGLIIGMIFGLFVGGIGIAVILLIILWPAIEMYMNRGGSNATK